MRYGAEMKRKPLSFADQLRTEICDCGVSRYRISKRTGISEGQLSKFMKGRVGLSLHAVDLLFQFLGIEISAISTKNKKEQISNG